MNDKQRHALRAAQLVRERLVERQSSVSPGDLPAQLWEGMVDLSRKIEDAGSRGWLNAARRLTSDLRCQLHVLQGRLLAMSNTLASRADSQVPVEGEIFREIMALEEEFEGVVVDLKTKEIRATTEPIVLEGIYLGPFQICLDMDRIGERSPYHIVALEPNQADSNESVTHPHVSDGSLCEGDGRVAIRSALESGRLYDFFVLVLQVLNTYARGQAYVELNEWSGSPCSDCGTMMSDDDRCSCRSCDDAICNECVEGCSVCERDFCANCIETCPVCTNNVCDSCLEACSVCGTRTCSDCLTDGACPRCQDEEVEDHESEPTTETAGAELAV